MISPTPANRRIAVVQGRGTLCRLLGLTTLLAFVACQEAGQGSADADAGAPADGSAEASASSAVSASVPAGTLLNPNAATRAELLTLPQVDDATADALLAGRPYDTMLDVDRVLAQSLSDEEREVLYGSLWKPLDLNTASAEEILLIPGVGDRMRHEFEEYRPYRAIAQFRREIGKYVDEAEVARLEQYVTIN